MAQNNVICGRAGSGKGTKLDNILTEMPTQSVSVLYSFDENQMKEALNQRDSVVVFKKIGAITREQSESLLEFFNNCKQENITTFTMLQNLYQVPYTIRSSFDNIITC
jgi:ABC-type lipoprotein export system ATPase subunit